LTWNYLGQPRYNYIYYRNREKKAVSLLSFSMHMYEVGLEG